MAREGRDAGFFDTIRPHLHECIGFLFASSGACLEIRDSEVERIDRVFLTLGPADLEDLRPPRSWLMAVVLCPGDDTVAVARWATGLSGDDVDRVRFYHLPGVDLVGALEAWYGASLPDPRTADVEDWASFHREFGWDHSNQVYEDVTHHPDWFD